MIDIIKEEFCFQFLYILIVSSILALQIGQSLRFLEHRKQAVLCLHGK